ncbi:hypothetical protein DIZ27_32835 [Streptomyces sp. NWU339]|uniref:hypothetical protein n=1 Tax=Streptomyces sp. NWU339 TaxID=2185284 RepID=UPI000D6743FA|nr:hypothetical protein [Streptomyces sp. NWU339]PWI06529.1 hypothetical protein DIZ27_32835 [Streptomyces sp. NWU339]
MSTAGSYAAPQRRQVHATATTDSNGNAVFAWPAGTFASPPVVTVALQGGSAFRSASVTANTAAATTVNVQAAAGVTLLGLGVLAVGAPAPGVVVHATATAP